MMSREFYNSIIKDKVELNGKNVVGAFMNVPIFVGNFSVVTRFVVVENIDRYRDQDMGDIILGEPFCKASCVEAKRFDGLITIHNGSDNVTYQMARSHPREFYNSIIKDKVEYKGKIVVGAFINVPIFVRKFYVVTHFVVVENIDGYRDQDMGDIILGEPFYKASCVEARRFDGLITIHNDSDNMTYQMERSHPRFKHLSNAQCNKIKPLLKVSLHDKLNRISHPYQNLKSFYKGVLNLGPKYVRDAKMEDGVKKAGREKSNLKTS
ncbi:hypothetical protein Tco_0826064 [Tanacetum coccineum]